MTKPRLPEGLNEIADAAGERMLARQAPPRVHLDKGPNGWVLSCPYSPEDGDRWTALLFDALGTRSGGMLDHFVSCIIDLVPQGEWNDRELYWYPDVAAFNAVLAIVSSLRPENEAQAAYAAQMAALHLSAMKLGANVSSYGDPRTVAILAKTSRAYGEGMERIARLQGKVQPRTVNQTIQVVYVDQRDERSVHFNGGASRNGGQPHGATGSAPIPCAALPGPCEDRRTLPLSSRARQTGVPSPRRSWWRSLWNAQR